MNLKNLKIIMLSDSIMSFNSYKASEGRVIWSNDQFNIILFNYRVSQNKVYTINEP